ncbi:MAG: glycine--tRNA ligase [Candidatus Thermoplasmatota archaeon]
MSQDIYEKIITISKRKGFFYPSFEIYGGSAGFYSYGPLGSRLKQNLEKKFREFYLLKEDCLEINTPNINLYEILEASGHVEKFTDLTVDCKKCNQSYKAEDLYEEEIPVKEAIKKEMVKCPQCGKILENPYPVNLMFSTEIGIGNTRKAFLRPETAQGIFTGFHLLYRYGREKLPLGVIQIGEGYRNEVSPRQGIIRLREFSMAEAEIFFDPENKKHPSFLEVKDDKVKLFDNENEIELTLNEAVNKGVINNQALAYYMNLTQKFLMHIGINPDKFRFRKHAEDELAHYAQECWDAEIYSERFGWIECVGIADRSAYDLTSHIEKTGIDMHAMRKFETPRKHKIKKIEPNMGILGPKFKDAAGEIKKKLEKKDPEKIKGKEEIKITVKGKEYTIKKEAYDIVETEEKQFGEKYIPHVIEPSYGMDRIFYCLLEHSYHETTKEGEEYHLLKFKPEIAPIKAGVFPLIKDEGLIEIAKKIDKNLRNNKINTAYDESGSIGRRYARMDEIGTPYCITVDHTTLEDDTVTIRDRDTTRQERIKIKDIVQHLKEKIE